MTSPTILQIISQSIHSIPGVPQEHKDKSVTKCDFVICWNVISELVKRLCDHFRLVSQGRVGSYTFTYILYLLARIMIYIQTQWYSRILSMNYAAHHGVKITATGLKVKAVTERCGHVALPLSAQFVRSACVPDYRAGGQTRDVDPMLG